MARTAARWVTGGHGMACPCESRQCRDRGKLGRSKQRPYEGDVNGNGYTAGETPALRRATAHSQEWLCHEVRSAQARLAVLPGA